jgi:6-pyruvoyltetrahydropterin/6-carboxytetrahydropterin synthase
MQSPLVKIGKDFHWEMAHRLPFHDAGCQNIHGHSYKMRIEIVGSLDENGMVMDFYNVAKVVQPLVDKLDHAFICNDADTTMIDFLKQQNFKHFIMPNTSTSEHMALYFAELFAVDFKKYSNLKKLTVRLYETSDAFAEIEVNL